MSFESTPFCKPKYNAKFVLHIWLNKAVGFTQYMLKNIQNICVWKYIARQLHVLPSCGVIESTQYLIEPPYYLYRLIDYME